MPSSPKKNRGAGSKKKKKARVPKEKVKLRVTEHSNFSLEERDWLRMRVARKDVQDILKDRVGPFLWTAADLINVDYQEVWSALRVGETEEEFEVRRKRRQGEESKEKCHRILPETDETRKKRLEGAANVSLVLQHRESRLKSTYALPAHPRLAEKHFSEKAAARATAVCRTRLPLRPTAVG